MRATAQTTTASDDLALRLVRGLEHVGGELAELRRALEAHRKALERTIAQLEAMTNKAGIASVVGRMLGGR